MTARVPDQKIEVTYSIIIDAEGNEKEHSVELELKNINVEYIASKGEHGVGLAPKELEIRKKETVVHFQTSAF